ncbi:hypothetical protein [uncultured Schumannella sp.]|uniref:hypothetical protein n=1 Tax=uncultured Schumannella sp. TaxID=1195956 RepID=UPI0025F5CC6B|nr:hypothetical protein [uncultured Schumannella sp.]
MSLTSRISSDWRRRHELRRFRLRVAVVFAVLLLAAGALAALSSTQGPRIQSVTANAEALVTQPGGVAELAFSRPIAEVAASDITLEPVAEFTVESSGSRVVLRFATALRAATEYRVTIEGVRGVAGGASGSVEATFETGALTVETVTTSPTGEAVSVFSTGVGSGAPQQLIEATGVREFVRIDDVVALVRDLDDERSALSVNAIDGTGVQDFVLPEEGRIAQLGQVGTALLFTLTSAVADPLPAFDLTLMRTDLAADPTPTAVLGLDGEPIATRAWFPIPGTADILIAARDGSVLRGDPSGLTPLVPVGQYLDVYGMTPDGSGFVAADAFGPVLVDLATGASTRITSSLIDGVEPYLGAVAMVDAERWVAKVAVPDVSGGFTTGIALDDGMTSTLIDLGGSGEAIADFRVSPGGQYLFVVLNQGSPGQPTTGPTLVVDLDTLTVQETLAGVDPQW